MLLEGVRVIEWSDRLAAAFCGRILADMGAEVIKIEPPGHGDPLRHIGPMLPGNGHGGGSALFAYANHGKRSITLDPATPVGAKLLMRLLEGAALLVESQDPATLRPLGLAGPEPYAGNPALAVLSATAAGRGSPALAETDLTLTHRAGYAYHQARPVRDPKTTAPLGGADREAPLAAGVAAATAALWGLLVAEQTGVGPRIDCAQLDFMAHLLIEPIADYNRGERAFGRSRNDLRGTEIAGGLVWMLPCRDGLVMISPREQHQWDRWVALLGHPAWSEDRAICGDREARTVHWARLQDEMSVWTRARTRSDVFTLAQAAKVACFPVSTPRDLLDNQQLGHRAFFDRLETADGNSVAMPGLPFVLRTSTGKTLERGRTVHAPALGEANQAVLADVLGMSAREIEALGAQNDV
jgi:crotonobetainyl-CoA:carnitine CoA-transferase CaiB-like acyl-CoA transferase